MSVRFMPPLALVALALAGCSSMPEWTKPSTWIDGVSDAGKSEPAPAPEPATAGTTEGEAAQTAAIPAAQRIRPPEKPTEFPEVGAQPEPRQPLTTEAEKREIRDSLVADRDNAKHTADELRGGAQPAAAPPPAGSAKTTPAPVPQDPPQ